MNGQAMTDHGHDLQPNEAPNEAPDETPTGAAEGHGSAGPHGEARPQDAAEPHGAGDHAMDPGHEHDDHGHMDVPLGPVDWAAWGAGALGVALGLIMWFCFAFATS